MTREAVAAADEADEYALACNAVLAELPEPRPGQRAAEALAATAEIGPENGKADILAWLTNYLPARSCPGPPASASHCRTRHYERRRCTR